MKTLRAGAALAAVAALALSACATNEEGGTTEPATSDATSAAAGGEATTENTASGLSGTLQGTGASSMKAAQEVWRAEFQMANPDVTVNYSPDGSGAGRTAFTDGAAAFAGSDRALKDDEMAGTFSQCAAAPINLPVYISPIAVIFNLEGVSELKLDAVTLAGIFKGTIANWNDPAIAALNEGVTFPDMAITIVHRSDNSGTTENFTDTLTQVAPEVWDAEASGDWPEGWPGEAAQGTSGVVAAVQNGAGTIGYADVSGVAEGMTMAEYAKDAAGEYVGPTAEAAAAIVGASGKVDGRADNDWALELDRTAAGYPFVLVSYAIACSEYADAEVGALVNAYISYIASDEGQQAAVPQAGNAPLTGELAASVQDAAAAIK